MCDCALVSLSIGSDAVLMNANKYNYRATPPLGGASMLMHNGR